MGIRINGHLNNKFLYVFNTISLEAGKVDQKGGGFELTTGYENTTNEFFSLYWSAGISGAVYDLKSQEPLKWLPVLKWEISINL